jgi:hypothetical protein
MSAQRLTNSLIDCSEGFCGIPIIATAQQGLMVMVKHPLQTHWCLIQGWIGDTHHHDSPGTVIQEVNPFWGSAPHHSQQHCALPLGCCLSAASHICESSEWWFGQLLGTYWAWLTKIQFAQQLQQK